MPRRVSLPGADELFRAAGAFAGDTPPLRAVPDPDGEVGETGEAGEAGDTERRTPGGRRSSGRQRRDEKITVYVSGGELVALEAARLALRAEHGLAPDRGRLVRAAVAIALADLDERGEASVLVRRLREG